MYKRGILVHPEDLTPEWIAGMKQAGLNLLGLHPAGGAKAHLTLQQAIDLHASPAMKQMISLAKDHGISVEYEAHAMRWLLPSALFDRNPNWFRMNEKGERTADFNLCASHPEALAYVGERTAQLAELLHTGESRYFFWLDDVTGCACHCAECRRRSASDQQLQIINAMLTGLRRFDPEAKLCYIAYHDTMDVPRQVEPMDGVFLEYAPINRDFHRPINDPDCAKNRKESRSLRELISFFGTEHARVLEYWMDNSLFSNWTRPPKPFRLDEDVMKADVDFYRSLGFETLTSFGCFLGPDYQALHGQPPLQRYGELLR